MSYNGALLSRIAQTIEGGQGEFFYQTTDSATTFLGAGYISDAGQRGIKLGDTVWVVNTTTGQSTPCYVSALSGSGATQTATLISNASPSFGSNFRNIIDGGDFTVNPFQRNIPGLASSNIISTAVSNTPTYFADRFFAVGGSSSSILMSVIADTTLAGFSQSLNVYRTSANSNTAAFNIGQIIETADAIKLQGQAITLSFYAKQMATYSGGALTVQVIYGTGTNQTAANMIAGSWTGQGYVINTTQVITSSYGRYQFTGTVPSNATQIGVLVTWTPTGTASGSTDGVTFQGFQLELGNNASLFEHRDIQVELEICQRYAWAIAEPANGVLIGAGTTLGANVQNFYMAAPVQFRAAPTVTLAAGSFKVAVGAAYASATTLAAGATHTVNAITITAANTASAGVGALLGGGGGSGYILATADF